jgi:hypothetical protein
MKFVCIAAITGSKARGWGFQSNFWADKALYFENKARGVFCLTLYCIFIGFFQNNLSQ